MMFESINFREHWAIGTSKEKKRDFFRMEIFHSKKDWSIGVNDMALRNWRSIHRDKMWRLQKRRQRNLELYGQDMVIKIHHSSRI